MREQEMRLRINRFLKARMSQTIMPAAMGLGLALTGCGGGGSLYMGPLPSDGPIRQDTLVEPLTDAPVYSAPLPDARDIRMDGSDVLPADADDAQAPDAVAADTGDGEAGATDATPAVDGDADLGGMIAKYLAPLPDAHPQDGTPVLRYMASFPDSGVDSA